MEITKWYGIWKTVLVVLNVIHKILHVIPGVKEMPLTMKTKHTALLVKEKINAQKDKKVS